jgi:hypothetical protein
MITAWKDGAQGLTAMAAIVYAFLLWLHSPIGPVGSDAFDGVWVRDPSACEGPLRRTPSTSAVTCGFPGRARIRGSSSCSGRAPTRAMQSRPGSRDVDRVHLDLRPVRSGNWTVRFAYEPNLHRLTPMAAGTSTSGRSAHTHWRAPERAEAEDERVALILAGRRPYVRCGSTSG